MDYLEGSELGDFRIIPEKDFPLEMESLLAPAPCWRGKSEKASCSVFWLLALKTGAGKQHAV